MRRVVLCGVAAVLLAACSSDKSKDTEGAGDAGDGSVHIVDKDGVLADVGAGEIADVVEEVAPEVVDAVELCRDHGLTPLVDFIVGFPFETDDDQESTCDLIAWVADRGLVHVHRFIPLPGTPLAGRSARPLLPRTEQLLGNLSLQGRLTGSWSDPETRFNRRTRGNDIQ